MITSFACAFRSSSFGVNRKQHMHVSRNACFVVLITTFAMATSIGCGNQFNPLFDVQGHRGARAFWPENSIAGFEYATSLGVTTLEMDVVVLATGEVLVSHEPWLNPIICANADGTKLPTDSAVSLFNMSLLEIQQCDCGSFGNPLFPRQEKVVAYKPTLAQVVQAVDRVKRPVGLGPVRFNIEIKFDPADVGRLYPEAGVAVNAVLALLRQLSVTTRTTVQSFSSEVMEAVHAGNSGVTTAWLMEQGMGVDEALGLLGFRPDIYSPQHALLSAEQVARAHELGVKVLPWTVNDADRMRELMEWGVDGLITDDPALALELASALPAAQ